MRAAPFLTRKPTRPLARALVRATLAAVLIGGAGLAVMQFRTVFVPATRFAGQVQVVDGDSLVASGERLRLLGIDAPELRQTCRLDERDYPCGQEAKRHLARLIGGRPVECVSDKHDRYGRALVLCRIEGTDLNAAMVRDGWAVAYGRYTLEEVQARLAGRGLWAGTFDRPEAWRHAPKRGSAGWDGTPGDDQEPD